MISSQVIPEIVKIIFSLKNVRRAPGVAGRMAGFTANLFGTDNRMYLTDTGNVSPWPGSLTLVVRPSSSRYPLELTHDHSLQYDE